MKTTHTLMKLFFLIITCTILTGCNNEKIYKNNGIAIKMDKGLFYKNNEMATIYYENDEIFVIGIKETFEELMSLDINNESTILEYVNEVFINSNQEYDLIQDQDLYYFTYEYSTNNQTYYYVSTIHKSYDSFWVCNFVCNKDYKNKYHDLFIKWAKSIYFY